LPEEIDPQKPKRPTSSLFLVKKAEEVEKELVVLKTQKRKLVEEVES
jgi:hypothetical protein